MIADLPPLPPEEIVVYRAADSAPMVIVGFVAFGTVDQLIALEDAAKLRGIVTARVEQDDPETMVFFRADTARSSAMDLFHKATSGGFGKLHVQALLVTKADAADGVDVDELRKYEPEDMRE